MVNIDEQISKLNLSPELTKKLKEAKINTVNDLWILKRKDLKEQGFNDVEIKSMVIALQLEGLDLNKKMYN